MKDTIRAIDSKCYGPDGEPKDSVDQDKHWLKTYEPPFKLPDELFLGFFEDDLR